MRLQETKSGILIPAEPAVPPKDRKRFVIDSVHASQLHGLLELMHEDGAVVESVFMAGEMLCMRYCVSYRHDKEFEIEILC